jgi:hypothetical protein
VLLHAYACILVYRLSFLVLGPKGLMKHFIYWSPICKLHYLVVSKGRNSDNVILLLLKALYLISTYGLIEGKEFLANKSFSKLYMELVKDVEVERGSYEIFEV